MKYSEPVENYLVCGWQKSYMIVRSWRMMAYHKRMLLWKTRNWWQIFWKWLRKWQPRQRKLLRNNMSDISCQIVTSTWGWICIGLANINIIRKIPNELFGQDNTSSKIDRLLIVKWITEDLIRLHWKSNQEKCSVTALSN